MTALAGDKDVFVKDVPKTLTFVGVLITDNDRVKVVAGASCDASALAAKFDNMALGESRALTFTFDVYTEEMMMCFRFAEDSTYVPLFPITVKVLNAAFFLTGHPEVVVARQPKTVTFTGEGLSHQRPRRASRSASARPQPTSST